MALMLLGAAPGRAQQDAWTAFRGRLSPPPAEARGAAPARPRLLGPPQPAPAPAGYNIPPSVLSCVADDAQANAQASGAQVCAFMHGLARVHHGGKVVMGTGIDNTVYYDNGCELPRFTIWIPPAAPTDPPNGLPTLAPTWTDVLIEARADGSEMIRITGWGYIELWPAEADVRNGWASLGPGAQTDSMAWAWITPADGGGYFVWIVRDDKEAACAALGWP